MKDKLYIKNEKGEEKEYDILFTFTKDEKNYITFTDYSHDESNNIKCYSKEQTNDNELNDITDENIYIVIDDMLKTITETEKYKNIR